MSGTVSPRMMLNRNQGAGHTDRRDAWWLEPVLTVLALGLFTAYAIWSVMQNNHYVWGPYLSPFYSPNLAEMFPAIKDWFAFSPAFLVLWIPLGFRGTCYFYRRAYYRAFFWDPPACAVDEPRGQGYSGERAFPFVFQNLHRYFFYLAALLALLHWTHAFQAFFYQGQFGMGVGTFVILLDAVFLTLYVFSCHSWRHLLAGKKDCFSCDNFTKVRHKAWLKQTKLNEHHMFFAWVSLFTVGFADFYVRLVASGAFQEWNTWGLLAGNVLKAAH
ncbi:MAG: succinate dehydrogenase [Candidatus Melainabacteria bacterium]|nr:succinate dehydrogenase [Candidatus Melainabacteria bacterium]